MAYTTLKGTEVSKRDVTISVSEEDIIEKVVSMIQAKHGIKSQSYLDSKGYIMEFSYTCGHTGDDEYERKGKATKEQVKIYETIDLLHNLLRN
jgi:hypothetical protein